MVANAENHNRIVDLLLRKGPWRRGEVVPGRLYQLLNGGCLCSS